MKTYFALFLIATIASLITTPLIRRLCQRLNLLDVPKDGRRVHRTAMPRLGGLALYLSCLTALSLLPFVDNLLTQTLRGYASEFLIIFVPATLVLLLGGRPADGITTPTGMSRPVAVPSGVPVSKELRRKSVPSTKVVGFGDTDRIVCRDR